MTFSEWGTPVRQYQTDNRTETIPDNAKVVAGLLVPADFDGSSTEAVETWGTASQQVVAEVLEEKDPSPRASRVSEKYDLTTRKAARLILEALRDSDSIDKGAASDIVRNNTPWKRVSKGRWKEVAECATEIASIRVHLDEESGSLSWWPDNKEPERPVEETPSPVEETPAPVEETPPPTVVAEELIEEADAYRKGFDAGYTEGRKEGAAISGEHVGHVIYVNCVPLREDYRAGRALLRACPLRARPQDGGSKGKARGFRGAPPSGHVCRQLPPLCPGLHCHSVQQPQCSHYQGSSVGHGVTIQ
jgi:hypothetical protein